MPQRHTVYDDGLKVTVTFDREVDPTPENIAALAAFVQDNKRYFLDELSKSEGAGD